ncbi:MAG: 1-(5-phosphoribosyl)-5-[(5-phosphoribosylamino)methylideneamino]imidazole-4-carboxamide isomerase [Candidatus Margulisbacteria bacterium GWF2_35_9]|nr:MAG: 1-(5-phosphoribosyl)-5-[(5-phosphoribosylamino)methylideneamino]imidazole-4-carboxamide isomerase [Candidatus Margulisbacteria bacterium GWF2_35_9]
MKIIPAIDLIDNKCVRLVRGNYNEVKVYSTSPVDMALELQEDGADILHIVDLDGAKQGSLVHYDLIKTICKELHIPVEVGGGVRNITAMKTILDAGARRCIIGTAIIDDEPFAIEALKSYPLNTVFGIDARGNQIAIKGWIETTKNTVLQTINKYEQIGLKQVIYTDIDKDGLLQGPNIAMLEYILENTQVQLIASGGVTTLEDIKKLCSLPDRGLYGIIVGKAIYEKQINIRDIKKVVNDNR